MARKSSRFIVFALIGTPICVAALLLLSCCILGPGYKWRLSHFLSEMKEEVSPEELREWAAKQIEDAHGERVFLSMPAQDSPETVAVLSRTSYGPPVILIVEPPNDQVQPHVEATWGGGFGHWGLIVGSPDLDVKTSESSYIVKWDDGVFGFAEIQR